MPDKHNKLKEFSDDEDNMYYQWIEEFRDDGFVLNSNKYNNQKYSKLHRANCWAIMNDKKGNWTNHGHKKICSENISDILDWCKEHKFNLNQYCKRCKPRQ